MNKHKSTMLKVAILSLGLCTAFGYTHGKAFTTYEVKKGDTLYSIATTHHLTVSELIQLNNLSSTTIYAGDELLLPTTITVKKGDTLYSLAKRHHTTVSQLKLVNRLTSNTIYAGQKLILPSYVIVTKGDTLYRIAKTFGLTVEELKSLNGLTSNTIKAGQKLLVVKDPSSKPGPENYDASKVKIEVETKKGFMFTAEEPRKFIVQYNENAFYFARIEVLDSKANISEIKKNSMDYLKGNQISEIPTNNSYHPFYKDAAFFLHGSNSKTQTNIVVKKVDGKLIRFTIHYLNKEESEGIVPMIVDILHTTRAKS
ncbi:MAG TPA: LysM peptidoglycan-binding domain-containing protein [Chondromyces sp.]|nr:LysM peptidoglycan-binding domain-containing protein [Chondromyces sp.]